MSREQPVENERAMDCAEDYFTEKEAPGWWSRPVTVRDPRQVKGPTWSDSLVPVGGLPTDGSGPSSGNMGGVGTASVDVADTTGVTGSLQRESEPKPVSSTPQFVVISAANLQQLSNRVKILEEWKEQVEAEKAETTKKPGRKRGTGQGKRPQGTSTERKPRGKRGTGDEVKKAQGTSTERKPRGKRGTGDEVKKTQGASTGGKTRKKRGTGDEVKETQRKSTGGRSRRKSDTGDGEVQKTQEVSTKGKPRRKRAPKETEVLN